MFAVLEESGRFSKKRILLYNIYNRDHTSIISCRCLFSLRSLPHRPSRTEEARQCDGDANYDCPHLVSEAEDQLLAVVLVPSYHGRHELLVVEYMVIVVTALFAVVAEQACVHKANSISEASQQRRRPNRVTIGPSQWQFGIILERVTPY